jgi:hypothetical protein
MKVAIVGATGMVGGVMLHVLEERMGAQVGTLLPVASERSAGKVVRFKGQEVPVLGLEEALRQRPDIALFSAGGETSLEWAPRFAEMDCTVIDNSSAWRMRRRSAARGARSERACAIGQRQDHRQPELQHHPNGDGIGPATQGVWRATRDREHVPSSDRHGHESRATDGERAQWDRKAKWPIRSRSIAM